MPFIELQDGTEILLDVSDIPEPPASTFTDNPYEANTTQFKRWRATAKARYTKAMYRARVDAKNEEHFLSLVGDAKSLLQDPSAWESYKSCRGLDECKRPVGRPKLLESEKAHCTPRQKRSDQMMKLLEENSFMVEDNMVLDSYGEEVATFLVNGRLFMEGETISVHAFLQQDRIASIGKKI